MTLLYRFTSGVHGALANSPFDTGRTGVSIPSKPTTRQGIYDAIADALYNAGMTRFNRKQSGASPNTNRDDLWFSDGEDGNHHLCIRTALSNSGSAGDRYLWIAVGPKRDDAATATNVNGTWNGTTTVAFTDTSQFRARSGSLPGSFIREDADGQWFEVTAISAGVSVTIDAGGFTIPNVGSAASSVLTPELEAAIGSQAFTNAAPFNTSLWRWDLTTSDFTADLQILVDKDFLLAVVQNENHTSSMYTALVGDAIPYDVNDNVMVLGSSVTNGQFKELLTEDGAGGTVNPLSIGFRPMDRIQVVNVDPNGDPRAETQVIVDVQSDRIKVRRLAYDYDGDDSTVNPRVYGARIGMYPQPVMMALGTNDEIEQVSTLVQRVRTPFYHDQIIDRGNVFGGTDGDLLSVPTSGAGTARHLIHYAQLATHAQTNDEYGSGISGNERTLRFTVRSMAFGQYPYLPEYYSSAILAKIPRIGSYNGEANFYPHDNYLRDRSSPQEDFIPFRFTSTSARDYVLGPTPG